jgi:hypothetical protein
VTLLDPVRLDLLQAVMVAVIQDATGSTARWSYGQGVYDNTVGASFVNLSLVGPFYPDQSAARSFTIQPCASVDFTVDAVVTGQLIGVYVNGVPFRVQVTGADTVDTIRDTLVGLIDADQGGAYTATAGVGAGAWTLAPTEFGSIYSVSSFGSMSDDVTLEDELASVTQGTARFVVTIEAFAKSRAGSAAGTVVSGSPRQSALMLASKISAALQLPDNALTFRDYGVGIGTIGTTTDLSAIACGNWETRAAFDVDVVTRFSVSRPVGQITTIEVASAFTRPTLTATIEATYP